MPTIQVRDIEVNFEEHGPVGGEPLVMLHGFTGNLRAFDRFLEPFGRQYRLITVDWRGHGKTTNPGDRQILHSELGKDLAAFCDGLGIKRAHFLGISSGAMQQFPLALARLDLVQTMTLVIGTHIFDDHAKQKVSEIAAGQRAKFLTEPLEDPTRQARRLKMTDQWEGSVLAPGDHAYTPAQLKTIARPALIVHGDRDIFFPVRIATEMYESLPNAELCVLPRCGHEVPERFAGFFVQIVLDFLGRNPLGADGEGRAG
ncbi:MAG: alpha/beta hydrolase [Phycisphaeraceae bacterium]|nr:alpha/beta hydrolase [Phycisphaeraceae bacterium]